MDVYKRTFVYNPARIEHGVCPIDPQLSAKMFRFVPPLDIREFRFISVPVLHGTLGDLSWP